MDTRKRLLMFLMFICIGIFFNQSMFSQDAAKQNQKKSQVKDTREQEKPTFTDYWEKNMLSRQASSFNLTNSSGTSLFYVQDDGKVGIRTTSPEVAFHISVADESVPMRITSTHGTITSLGIQNNASGGTQWYLGSVAGTGKFYLSENLTTSAKLTVQTNGNVGIGTTSPQEKLEVVGSIRMVDGNEGAGKIMVSDADGRASWALASTTSDGDWTISGNDMYSNVSGNVGVGITSPVYPLDVDSTIGIDNTQVLFLPDQTKYSGTLIVGDGGGSLSQTNPDDGIQNVAVGIGALNSLSTGFSNIGIGYRALYSNTSAESNTAIGHEALRDNTTGSRNFAGGTDALAANTSGWNNTATGFGALGSNISGSDNTATGWRTLFSNTTGDYNTASGMQALYTNTTGYSNTAMGWSALYANTEGTFNTAVGQEALHDNTTGGANTATGYRALFSHTTGQDNTAVGFLTLQSNTTGQRNSALGCEALNSITTGNYNTAVGFAADYFNETGSNNTIIGFEAGKGSSAHNKSGNVFIGYQAGYDETGDSLLYIENSRWGPPLIWGDFSKDSLVVNGDLTVTTEYRMPTGAADGYVLTSDASGIGTWQDASLISDGDWTISDSDIYSGVSGNVGIGTTSPYSPSGFTKFLNIEGTDDAALELSASNYTENKWTVGMVSGSFDIRKNNNAQMRILNNGNVGIGVTSPSRRLHVYGPENLVAARISGNTTTNTSDTHTSLEVEAITSGDMQDGFGGVINFMVTDDAASLQNLGSMGIVRSGADNNGDMIFRPAASGVDNERMRITSTGKVGIGTTSPFRGLHVYSSSDNAGIKIQTTSANQQAILDLQNDAQWWQIYTNGGDADKLYFRDNTTASDVMVLNTNGELGIGTTSPNELLTVEGVVSLYEQSSDPGTTSGYGKLYGKTDGKVYFRNDGGTTYDLTTGSGLWEPGTNGVFEDDQAVIIGADATFSFGSGGLGDLRITDEVEVLGDGYINNDLVVGASTSSTETIENAGFMVDGNDLFVAGTAGIEGNVYTDGSFVSGSTLTMGDGSISQSSGALGVNLGGSSGDDFIVDTDVLVVESDNNRVGIGTTDPTAALDVVSSSAPVVRAVRTSTETDDHLTTFLGLAKTSGDMEDWFGPLISFQIQDNTDGPNSIAYISARRDGADNSGMLTFETINSGAKGTRMVIDRTGNVGIGTVSPEVPLHLSVGDNSIPMRITSSHATITSLGIQNTASGGTQWYLGSVPSSGKFYLSEGTTTNAKLTVQSNGRVGIGTTSPGELLDVNGKTKTTELEVETVTITDVLTLIPRSLAPTSPSEGEIYVDSSDHHIYCYLDGSWKQLD